ncbi:MAG: DNA methyltransferase [Rhodothermaceae bacterium]
MTRAIEKDFPFEAIDKIAEKESYRKEINRPLYHIHKWWAKRLGSVFRAIVSGSLSENSWTDFYNFQNFDEQIVLDPFMGSGTTLGEAAKLGAKVIGCDVNPVSTFLVKQALQNVNIEKLNEEFRSIEHDVSSEIQSYYKTITTPHSEPTPALYYFWVKIVQTPNGEEIPLFSSYIFSKNAYPQKKPECQIYCPFCENIFKGLNYNLTEKCPSCLEEFNPHDGPVKGSKIYDKLGVEYKIKELVQKQKKLPKHKLYAIMALNEKNEKVYLKPSAYDFQLLNKAGKLLEKLENKLPLPTMHIRQGHNTDQAKSYNYKYWRDFFNERQLLCLGLLLRRILQISNKVIRDHFICLFSGTLEFNNLFCTFKGEGTGAVRHMFSHHILKPERTPLENSVWGTPGKSSGTFSSLYKSRLIKAKKYLSEPFELSLNETWKGNRSQKIVCSNEINLKIVDRWNLFSTTDKAALILNGDSSKLPIPDESVDSIVTDPPYFDFIHYSELSDFFYAWLSNCLGNEYEYLASKDSSHKNEVQDKDYEKFSNKLSEIFKECYRVLKKDAIMSFSYHHSTIEGWLAIYDAVQKAKFEIIAAHPVKAEMSVASPKNNVKDPINIDAILVCKKDSNPPQINDGKKEVIRRYKKYLERFEKIGRILSAGDKFVIACSQAISVASILRMRNTEVQKLIIWSVDEVCIKR